MTGWTLDVRFRTEANSAVFDFLREHNPSAHSDVAEELSRAGSTVAGLQVHCPEPSRYAFVVLHQVDWTIVGLASGMRGLAFRLPDDRVAEALEEGGTEALDIGRGWVRLAPWLDEETLVQSRRRLARWCAVAAGELA